MKIFHLSNDFYPHVTGGTEVFIHQLINAQIALRPSDIILWVVQSTAVKSFSFDSGLASYLRLLPPIASGSRRQQVGSTAASIPGFAELLQEYCPDVVHLHSFSDRCGLSHARAVKSAGARLVVTVHAPGFSCIKGNLIDASGAICDGLLRERRCTRCRLHNGGLPRWLAGAVALQQGWPCNPDSADLLSHVVTARQLTAAFHKAWLELVELADAIHVLAAWSREVLLRQGIPAEKVHLIRTAGPAPLPFRKRSPMEDGVLRLVYWGRCHPVKGLHLVIEAILALPPDAPIHFDCYGPYWDSVYGQQLLSRIAGDRRFRVLGNLPKDQLLFRLQQYDLAVVPSTWLETGPLTVLEAFAAGLPVAGSNLGGVKELLQGVSGCKLLPLDWRAWSHYFTEILCNPGSLVFPNISKYRLFGNLATDLFDAYQAPLCSRS